MARLSVVVFTADRGRNKVTAINKQRKIEMIVFIKASRPYLIIEKKYVPLV